VKPGLCFLFFVVFTIATYSLSTAQSESCSDVTSTSATSIKFLEEQKDTRESSCIRSVIRRLGRAHEVRAMHILASYLDFADPATLPRPDGFATVRPDYPAVDALFLIGKPATLELLSAIQIGKTPVARQNAAKAYLFVYRDDLAMGIRILKREELIAKSESDRAGLREALKILTDDCRSRAEQDAESCKSATQGN
jgi:hypothetical protein